MTASFILLTSLGTTLSAVVSQVDQRVDQCLEGIVHGADPLKAQQQDETCPLVKMTLATAFGLLAVAWVFRDDGRHAAVEDGLAILVAVVHAIQTHYGAHHDPCHRPGRFG